MFEKSKGRLYNQKIRTGYYRFDHIKPEFRKMYFDKFKNELQRIVSEGLYDEYMKCLNDSNRKIFDSFLHSETPDEVKLKMDNYEFSILLNKINKEKENLLNELFLLKTENFTVSNLKSHVNLNYELSRVKEKNRILTIQNRRLQKSILSLKKGMNKTKKSKGLNLRKLLKKS